MKILVTGATGFIGSHLIPALLDAHYETAILKREKSELKNLISVRDMMKTYRSDTYDDIYRGIHDFMPDVVIHLATLYLNKHNSDDIEKLIDANITFGSYILEAMTENKIIRFINIGTQAQHFGDKQYCPVNLYAATKQAFKDILSFYEEKGIVHKTIELFDTYGEGDTRKKIMDLLISACKNNQPLELTAGEQTIDLSYVGDICAFMVKYIGSNDFFDNETIALSGNTIELRELGDMIENEFEVKNVLRWGAKPYRENEMMRPPVYYRQIKLNQRTLEEYVKNVVNRLNL
jgi:nucleoside-diphosphate-sugar epimerase